MKPSEVEVILALHSSKKGLTRHQIAYKTGRLDHSICARIGDLEGLLKVIGKSFDLRTRKHVNVYALTSKGVSEAKKLVRLGVVA